MKIIILTAFHKRPHISQLYWLGIERLRKKFNIKTFAVISDDENKLLASLFDSDYVAETENNPLGKKMNFAMEQLMDCDFDFMMQMGSDNAISNQGMETNLKYMNEYSFFGHTNLILADTLTKECKIKKYGNIFGAGRCISKNILPKCLPLWEDEKEKGLDINSERRIEERMGIVAIPVNDTEIIDFKSDTNIWSYQKMDGIKCSDDILIGKITTKEKNYFYSL